ncbi:MAG: hypothetical protein KDK37_04125 [Leptospiraceae bacterium]|nr:hypothetical protein [Leptospiraceae bacterium]MCB1303433.1 hypothetical protein [Leptospiraceae bacterium]
MNRILATASIAMVALIAACGMKSEGTKLAPIIDAGDKEVGKEHVLTLEHKNVFYTSGDRSYVWAQDDDGKYLSVYYSDELKPKIYNLDPGSEYMYKFTVTEGGKYPKAQLIDVADLEGSVVGTSMEAPENSMRIPFLDGKEGFGKEYTVRAKFSNTTKKDDGTNIAYFRDPDGYQFSLVGTYPDDMQEQIDGLERKVYLVKIKRASELYGGLKADILEIKPAE